MSFLSFDMAACTQTSDTSDGVRHPLYLSFIEWVGMLSLTMTPFFSQVHGLLPHTVKVELEDTISSLRQQVHLLQSQVDLLREECDVSASFNKSAARSRHHVDKKQHELVHA